MAGSSENPSYVGPAIVARTTARVGREGPVLPGDADLLRGRAGDPAHQARVARGAEADVVREERGNRTRCCSVDRVDPPHDGIFTAPSAASARVQYASASASQADGAAGLSLFGQDPPPFSTEPM